MIDEEIKIQEQYNCMIKKYKLEGLISFYPQGNFYVSFCKSPVDNKWYFYNSSKVNEISIQDVIEKNNNNNQYRPYILIYALEENIQNLN